MTDRLPAGAGSAPAAPAPMRRRSFLAVLAAPAFAAGPSEEGARVVAVLVRHAEKAPAPESEKDPDLSEAGRSRAALLSEILGGAGVTHLFATEFRRTRETLRPLAERAKLAVEGYPAADAQALAARLRALPAGSVAVVAAHSNTLPRIAAALGAALRNVGPNDSLRDDEYGRLVAVFPGASSPERNEPGRSPVLDLRYGD